MVNTYMLMLMKNSQSILYVLTLHALLLLVWQDWKVDSWFWAIQEPLDHSCWLVKVAWDVDEWLSHQYWPWTAGKQCQQCIQNHAQECETLQVTLDIQLAAVYQSLLISNNMIVYVIVASPPADKSLYILKASYIYPSQLWHREMGF